MAFRGVLTHRKTRRLAKLLSIPPCYALGVLESLWHLAAEQHHNGDLSSLSASDIAEELFYEDDPDKLLYALIESGWLDANLYIHDWHEHAPSYVHAHLAKKTLLFANGTFPAISHDAFNAQTRDRIRAEYAKKYPDLSGQSPDVPGQVPDKSRTVPGQVRAIPNLTQPNQELIPGEIGSIASECASAEGSPEWRRKLDPFQKFAIPNLKAVKGKAVVEGAPTGFAEGFFAEMEGREWCIDGQPIDQWSAVFAGQLRKARRTRAPAESPPISALTEATDEELERAMR